MSLTPLAIASSSVAPAAVASTTSFLVLCAQEGDARKPRPTTPANRAALFISIDAPSSILDAVVRDVPHQIHQAGREILGCGTHRGHGDLA